MFRHALRLIPVMALASPCLAQFYSNLVRNPSFDNTAPQAGGNVSIDGSGLSYVLLDWNAPDRYSLDSYDGQYAPYTGTHPGGGLFYLAGRYTPLSTLSQSIDVQFAHDKIDAGSAVFLLSAHLGSFKFADDRDVNQDDIATLSLRWQSTVGETLAETVIVGPNFPQEHGLPYRHGTFLIPFAARGHIPAGARVASINIQLARDPLPFSASDFNNASVDDVRLTIAPTDCSADATMDGFIDDTDFVLFAAQYAIFDCQALTMPPGCLADLNHDGFVDDIDFVIFAQGYDRFACE